MKPSSSRFISVGHLVLPREWKMAFHSHPFHELIIVVAGSLGVEINGQTIEACPGDILWYPQGVRHREWTDPKDPGETFFVAFEDGGQAIPAILHQPDAQGRIQVLARWLYAEREARASSGALHPENAFLQALLAEYRRLTTRREDLLVTRMRTYMRQRLSKPISLDDLAAFAQMSKYHFLRHYKALAGCTPMRDLRSLRIQAARDLLLTTNLPLKEISPRTGLGDEYHLSRLFRIHFNITPGAMRRTSMINPL